MWKKSKGELSVTTETGLVLTIMVFVTALIWFTQQVHQTFPSVEAFPDFSYILFGLELIGIAVACNIVTGFACIAAGAFVGVVNFFFIPVMYQIIMLPLMAVLAYIIGRLMRGGG